MKNLLPILGLLAMLSTFATFAAGAVWLFARLTFGRRARQVQATAQFTVRELGGIPLNGDVKLFGTAGHTEAPLLSPLSGTPCLWHRVTLTEYTEVQVERTDAEGNTTHEVEQHRRVIFDQASERPIFLTDPTGVVALMPQGVAVGAPVTFHQGRGDGYGDSFSQGREDGGYEGAGNQPGDLAGDAVRQIQHLAASRGQQLAVSLGGAASLLGDLFDGGEILRRWVITEEQALTPGVTAMVLAQAGQVDSGGRYLHAADRGRDALLELAASPEAFAENVEQGAQFTGKAGKAAVVLLALSALLWAAAISTGLAAHGG